MLCFYGGFWKFIYKYTYYRCDWNDENIGLFLFKNVIPNAHFIIDLLDIVLKNSLITFDSEYFQQFFWIIMGTNLAPIVANLYSAMLQEELKKKYGHDKKT